MAANGAQPVFTTPSVVAALTTMKAGQNDGKKTAHEYLERFQKSKDAWAATLSILKSDAEPDVKLFAAITLRGKITYDLVTQVAPSELSALRNEILILLKHFAPGPRPIRVALAVCLAILAIQMREWKDVITTVISSFGDDVNGHACILDFLRVLPEEVTMGRKIPMTESELNDRTAELLGDSLHQVVSLLINYSQSSPEAARNPQLIECITSWLREMPVATVVQSPLLDVVFGGVLHDETIHEAAECLCAVFGETFEVDENFKMIEILFPRVVALVPQLQKASQDDDTDSFKALTKIIAKAAQSWAVAIVSHPEQFRPLVEAVLECAARDRERDAIEYTFDFWYDLRIYLTVDKYAQSRVAFIDIFPKLVSVLLERLQYPVPESGDERDLFEGDREQEDKFREFRHRIGDTLKDAAEVMGVSNCLRSIYEVVEQWMRTDGARANGGQVPNWQKVESSLFAMRALGSEVPKYEEEVLHLLIPLLVSMPNHNKLRFATTMVFGRYTEWTAAHPQFLQPQFNYIISSFESDSKEVIRAAAMAIKYFCVDCQMLLTEQVLQLQVFYDGVLDKLPDQSQEEITEGVAAVVGVQPVGEIYKLLKLYCDPLVVRLMKKANDATNDKSKLLLADHIQLITVFVTKVIPTVEEGQVNPAVTYWQEVFPVLATILENFSTSTPICERVCRCWRNMLISYRTAMTPLLPELANKLAHAFESTREGCFLWVTASILREFSPHRENVDPQIVESIYAFFEAQTLTFLRVMNGLQAKEFPDVIEDFFRLLTDALLHYPHKLISSNLLTPVFQAATYSLVLEQRDPVDSTLHFLRDLLTYGSSNPAGSQTLPDEAVKQVRDIVLNLLNSQGETLVKQIVAGLVFTFDEDCYSNATGVLESMLVLLPQQTLMWLKGSLELLPPGTLRPNEATQFVSKIQEKLPENESGLRQIRQTVQNFAFNYRRRHVAPRDGLGQLEATRFKFAG